MTFLGAAAGLVALSRRIAGDTRWRGTGGYALGTGIAILVLIPAHSVLALPVGAPLHAWWGLLNWASIVVWLACVVVLALRLLRVARAEAEPR
ncbi:MAG TPA: hypothetical protein VD903_09990 [Pseudonocardia sp.]|nr:hypothetical protein [Pseudonocardia sp.]